MKILIAGYYGFGNLGDELILTSIVSQVQKRYPGSSISVLSPEPVATATRHKIAAIPRWNPVLILTALWKNDVFILGGGGLLQNKTSNRSLFYYLALVAIARFFQNPVVLYAIGVEHIEGELWRTVMRVLFSGKKVFITVRDNESKELFIAMGLPAHKIFVTADPVFSKSVESRPQERYLERPVQLLLIPRFPCPAGAEALFDRLARIAIEEKGVAVKATVFQPSLEMSFLRSKGLSMAPLVDNATFDSDPAAMSFFDVVVSARFHGLVLASLSGKPFLGIGDPDKNKRLCEKMGMPFLFWNAGDSEIRSALERLLELRDRFDTKDVERYRESANSTLNHVFL